MMMIMIILCSGDQAHIVRKLVIVAIAGIQLVAYHRSEKIASCNNR